MHKHHIIPKHMGGSNDPSNLVLLTVEEHAEAHKVLFETHGKIEDLIAYRMLSGQITAEEAIRQATIAANKGRALSSDHKEKIRKSNKGKQAGEKHPMFGRSHTPEAKIKNSIATKKALASGKPVGMMGKKHSETTRRWMASRPKINGKFVKVENNG